MRPTVAERLAHIDEAIDNIRQMLAGRTRAAFVEDMMLRLAVERSLEIISEASRHIPPDLKAGECRGQIDGDDLSLPVLAVRHHVPGQLGPERVCSGVETAARLDEVADLHPGLKGIHSGR